MEPVIIIGAGLSGLSCALHLHKHGIPFLILEGRDAVGGRVRTDRIDGYQLDHGFQVYLDAYPEAGKLLNLEELNLKPFAPGALVYNGRKLHRVMDVFRQPSSLISSALAPIGSVIDKLRVALLRFTLLKGESGNPDQKTEIFLTQFGFSPRMVDTFFRSFYGGIFLENELRTSSKMFEFTFRMFSKGSATLPASGMQAIPEQLARRLPAECLRLNTEVSSLNGNRVTLKSGETLVGKEIVVATNAHQAGQLVPRFLPSAPSWRSVTNLYFSADEPPFSEAIIALNGTGRGVINNIAILSNVAPSYAPVGKALISVSVLGVYEEDLVASVRSELELWFGPPAREYHHVRTDEIRHALPEQPPRRAAPGFIKIDDVYLCGDHTSTASIEGAIISGQQVASSLIQSDCCSPKDSL